MSASTKQTQQNVKQSLSSTWDQNHRDNSVYNVGAEIEDLLFDEEGDPVDNEMTEAVLRNIVQKEDADPEEEVIDGEERLLGTRLPDERFQRHEDFAAEIDTDYHPAQSEVATEVFQNPADMAFRTENLRYLRDRNLPEGVSSHELGMFPGLSAGERPEHLARPKKRYTGLGSRHGDVFGTMGWIGSTQLNTGSPAGEEMSTEEFFHSFFGGKEGPSMLDVVPAVDPLFASDPVFEENDDLYEMLAEGGRDMVYDLFVSRSPAVLRRNTERWGDILDEALPTNENYGYIEDLRGLEDQEDYLEMAMERPMILSPEIDASDVEVLDPETHQPVGTFEEVYGEDSTWVMPGLSDVEQSTVTFEQFLEDEMYLGEVLVDGEMKPVKVDHSDMGEKDFYDLAGLGSEDSAGYFTLQNTFVRPDVAPKNNGVVEFRSFSNSDRSYEALLTQNSLMHVYQDVQELFGSHGLTGENSLEFREDAKRKGLDAELPSGFTVQEVYENELVDVLSEGVRQSFSGETPYSMEIVLEGVDSYEEFEDYLDAEFDDLSDFAEYTAVAFEAGVRPEPGDYSGEEYREEQEQFVDWFVDTYEEKMHEYLDDGFEGEDEYDSRNFKSESEKILAAMNRGGPEAVLEVTERSDNRVEAR
ncbi:MAG: hypothetical protein ABEJ87_02065 [Candidatus Nanohalobium sp.]